MPARLLVLLCGAACVHAATSTQSVNVTEDWCGKEPKFPPGKQHKGSLSITDPNTGKVYVRNYEIYVPSGYVNTKKTPLMLVYHGWGGYMGRTGYSKVGDPDKYATVYLKGLSDFAWSWQNSWNVGNAGDLESCTTKASGFCYDSCKQLDKCSRCNSYTCVDDVYFTKKVIEQVSQGLCVDPSRLYAVGYSNGAQFVYKLVSDMPGVFAGAVAVSGTPFYGYERLPNSIKTTAFMNIHGLEDKTIPYAGGVSNDFWTYTAVDAINRMWADVQGCSGDSLKVTTPYDGADGLDCTSYDKCPVDLSTVHCRLDGGHMQFPSDGYKLVWWFLSQFKLGTL